MQPEDLLNNDDFIRWVINPDPQTDKYWNDWIGQDPLNKAVAAEAKEIVLSVYQNERRQSQQQRTELARQAWQEINRQLEQDERETPRRKKMAAWIKYASAAAVLAAVTLTFFLISDRSQKPGVATDAADLVVSNISPAEIQFNNNGRQPKIINLADGSRVTLSANSSLHYARLFNGGNREVYLEGEAFFEVARDAQRPFYVYSGNVVTKVVGTSFRISSDDRSGKVVVAVKTGKVTVSRQDETATTKEEYVLIPNKQLVFIKKSARPVIETIENETWQAAPIPVLSDFRYDGASFNTILETLAKTYAVDIVHDKVKSEKCFVTVSLDGESLYEKLDLLCKVTGATYHTEGYKIYVDSKGCN